MNKARDLCLDSFWRAFEHVYGDHIVFWQLGIATMENCYQCYLVRNLMQRLLYTIFTLTKAVDRKHRQIVKESSTEEYLNFSSDKKDSFRFQKHYDIWNSGGSYHWGAQPKRCSSLLMQMTHERSELCRESKWVRSASKRASGRVNGPERCGARAKRAMRSKRVSCASKRVSRWASGSLL